MSDAHDLHTGNAVVRQRADAHERAAPAWGLRVLGASWSQVAREVGFSSASTACRAVRLHFDELPSIDREESRRLWRARYEYLWRQAVRDVDAGRPGSIRSAVALGQRAAALDGLDEPVMSVLVNPSAAEFSAVVAALTERAGETDPVEADIFAADDDAGS